MRQYEVTFIVDPVLSGDEIKSTAKTYEDMLVKEGSQIVHIDEMGLKQLAYPISKRNSGIFYTIEFSIPGGTIITKLELSLRRDERIMRFLTVKLDKYGVKYNEDKRNGLIGVAKRPEPKKDNRRGGGRKPGQHKSSGPKPQAVSAPVAISTPPVVAESPIKKSEEE